MENDINLIEKEISREYIFNGKIINLRVDKAELPNKKITTREIIEHNGGVCMVPLTKDNELIFVKQFRYPYKKIILELPAGKLEKGENPLDAGKRELQEETGAISRNIVSLGTLYPSPGYTDEIIHIYLATNLTLGAQNPDEDEFLNIIKLPLEDAVKMVLNNEIPDYKTQVGILKTYFYLKKNI